MRHMHGAETHICSAVQPKHAPPCGIAIHMKGSARQRKTNMEKDNMNDELLGGLPESDADGAEYLKISVVSIPEKGKANKELLSFLAKRLKTAKSNFEIISGASERCKRILIKGIDAVQAAEILRQGE